MTEPEYLNLVRVYLSQELPEIFRSSISVSGTYIRVDLPADVVFDKGYAKLKSMIEESAKRIRGNEHDMNFTIWSSDHA